jgi:hypothetical protein
MKNVHHVTSSAMKQKPIFILFHPATPFLLDDIHVVFNMMPVT